MSICSTTRSKGVPNAADNISAIGRPRHGKISLATRYSGRSRSKLYQWAAEHEGLFLKDGASTLVDFDVLDRIMDSLPPAKITMPHLTKRARSAHKLRARSTPTSIR
jgi:hypothetical protein